MNWIRAWSCLAKSSASPLVIAAMTGGTDRAGDINRRLAEIAEDRGYGFGVGSQRAMQKNTDSAWTYSVVREAAPTSLVLGNIGIVQARDSGPAALADMAGEIGADALCVHMNPAMELIQEEGDRDFRGCRETLARLVAELDIPVIAKETGNGISPQTARALSEAGVTAVDVSGAGGTSWVGVETLRAKKQAKKVGELFWDWGVPTAPAIAYSVAESLTVIATGGIRTGQDMARAIALGADCVGIARPVLQALEEGGRKAVDALFDGIERELRTAMLLTGSRTVADLQKAPRILTGELPRWLEGNAQP